MIAYEFIFRFDNVLLIFLYKIFLIFLKNLMLHCVVIIFEFFSLTLQTIQKRFPFFSLWFLCYLLKLK